jgi:hypothetical protein
MIGRATLAAFFLAITLNLHTAAPPSVFGDTVFQVRDFGAVPDGQTESGDAIRAAIAAAVAAKATSDAPVEVVLEAGTYRVRYNGRQGYCFPIHQAANLVVRGEGQNTKILITDPKSGGFLFGLCRQITLRDLVVDYDPLPFCLGTVPERAPQVQQTLVS